MDLFKIFHDKSNEQTEFVQIMDDSEAYKFPNGELFYYTLGSQSDFDLVAFNDNGSYLGDSNSKLKFISESPLITNLCIKELYDDFTKYGNVIYLKLVS